MMFKQKIILLFLVMYVTMTLHAAWLENIPEAITQPDGTRVEVLTSGDEFRNWAHDADGFTMILDVETGFWCWAKATPDGDVASTGYPIHLHTPQSLNLTPRVNISQELYYQRKAMWETPQYRSNTRTQSKGEVINLVVYIRCADDTEFEQTTAFYNQQYNMFNQTSETQYVDSMRQFFRTASRGQLDVYSPLFPNTNPTLITSVVHSKNRSYFQPYSSANTNGYSSERESYQRLFELVSEGFRGVANQIAATDLKIDSDNDNWIDNIVFVVRGNAGAWSSLLWSHKFTFPSFQGWGVSASSIASLTINGKRANDYNLVMQNHMSGAEGGTGVLCHEFVHSMGVPDFYRYDNFNINPVGPWCLMASTSTRPQMISAHVQEKYLDWIKIPELMATGVHTLSPLAEEPEFGAVRIRQTTVSSPNQYYIAEYRRRATAPNIDSTIPGSGLIFYRVNTTATGSQQAPEELYVYRPNGTITADGQITNAHFSASVGRTIFNSTTNPNPFLLSGTGIATVIGDINVSDIGLAGDTISFTLNNMNTEPLGLEATLSETTISLVWNQPTRYITNVVGYNIYHNGKMVGQTNGNSITTRRFTHSQPVGGNNFYHVTTRFNLTNPTATGESGPSNIETVYLQGEPTFPPPRNVATTPGVRELTVTWDPPQDMFMSDLDSYKLFKEDQLLTQLQEDIENLEYTDTGLTAGQTYEYYLIAVYKNGQESVASNKATGVPLDKSGFYPPRNFQGTSEINAVNLTWEAPEHDETTPDLVGYRIYRGSGNGEPISELIQDLHYSDTTGVPGTTYRYHVVAFYENPEGSGRNTHSILMASKLDVSEHDVTLVRGTALIGNYPNPFNPLTTISFSVGANHNAPVQINIYNIRGQIVRTLVDGVYSAGNYTVVWNGLDDHGLSVSSGIYMYQMITTDYTEVKKMILMK